MSCRIKKRCRPHRRAAHVLKIFCKARELLNAGNCRQHPVNIGVIIIAGK